MALRLVCNDPINGVQLKSNSPFVRERFCTLLISVLKALLIFGMRIIIAIVKNWIFIQLS